MILTRRELLWTASTLAVVACNPSSAAPANAPPRRSSRVEEIEKQIGGRVGVFAVDTERGRTLEHRADERFAMCSTFKWVLAALVVDRAASGALSLDERIPYGKDQLLHHAPITEMHLADGSMTIDALAEAAVTVSDNTAANLLLERVGGPSAFTDFCRRVGDRATRLDRVEPDLNENDVDDVRDTTTPRAMAGLARAVLTGDVLAPSARDRLTTWMRACKTGGTRLRAGFSADWSVADKTGTGERGACNDVAVATRRDRAPVIVAAYLAGSTAPLTELEAALAAIGAAVAAFAS